MEKNSTPLPELPDLGLTDDVIEETADILRQRLKVAEYGWSAPSFYAQIPFFDQIRMGDYEGLIAREEDPAQENDISLEDVPLFSDDPRKNIEYGVVANIALCMQAAIEGGLDPTVAYSIASTYYRKVGHGQDREAYTILNYEMVVTFAKAVQREHAAFHRHPIVKQCDHYIMNHLTTPFSLEELELQTGYSAGHLQRTYKVEAGMTLTEMHRLARIRLAMYWLEHTDLPISGMSQQLCFSSQSHFGSVFKAHTGFSPREYRKQFHSQGS